MSEVVSSYDEIVERNAIAKLMATGDLTLRDGDIAVTRWGDLMLNDVDYSAYFRMVQVWRYNFPTIATLFLTIVTSINDKTAAEAELNALGGKPWNPSLGLTKNLDPTAYHAACERIEAIKVGRDVYAGTISLFLSRILGTFRTDISATMDEWGRAGDLVHGQSFGQAIEAAANNVRHADEWQVATNPTPQQMRSVNVLAAVLQKPLAANGSIRMFAYDVSFDILSLLSGLDFLVLEKRMFAFTSALLALREKPCPSQ